MRVYLDGSETPAVDLPFVGYFDRKNAPFTQSALVHTVARGWNNYVPIPYQKLCKIVADPGWGQYFHFTYATLPAGTVVPTFKRELSAEEAAALDRANEKLTRCASTVLERKPSDRLSRKQVSVAPGKTGTIATFKGPRAVTGLRMKLDLPAAPADRDVLRQPRH